MKRTLIASAVCAAFIASPALAVRDASDTSHAAMPMQIAQAGTQQAPKGMGPGMMGQGQGQGQGMGPGMMGQGYGPGMMGQGVGPGMMGQGYGPGMMGQGMGPGMMGQGYGPGMMGQGMGPGMMGYGMMGQGMGSGMMGYGMMGQGMGPGMMGGMMGPGMMYGGANPYVSLDLSADQRAKISAIQEGLWRKQWDLMGKMHEERYHMHQLMSGAVTDEAAARKAYQSMADAHKQMFDAMLAAHKQIDAVLTKEQRDKLTGGG